MKCETDDCNNRAAVLCLSRFRGSDESNQDDSEQLQTEELRSSLCGPHFVARVWEQPTYEHSFLRYSEADDFGDQIEPAPAGDFLPVKLEFSAHEQIRAIGAYGALDAPPRYGEQACPAHGLAFVVDGLSLKHTDASGDRRAVITVSGCCDEFLRARVAEITREHISREVRYFPDVPTARSSAAYKPGRYLAWTLDPENDANRDIRQLIAGYYLGLRVIQEPEFRCPFHGEHVGVEIGLLEELGDRAREAALEGRCVVTIRACCLDAVDARIRYFDHALSFLDGEALRDAPPDSESLQ